MLRGSLGTLDKIVVMLRLLPFTAEHFSLLAEWFGTERDLVQWGGPLLSFPLSATQCASMLDEDSPVLPRRRCWMAEKDSILIGHAQLVFDWRNGNATVSRVAVAPHARGNGLAQPMLGLIIAEAFGRLDIERLELNVYVWNTAAIRTYQRLGFLNEGIRRSSTLVGQERWDTAIMGLLRPEWARITRD